MDSQIVEMFGLDGRGASVASLTVGGEAQAAGLAVGDIVRSINGIAVESPAAFVELVSGTPAESRLVLEVWRRGDTIEVQLGTGDVAAMKTPTSSPPTSSAATRQNTAALSSSASPAAEIVARVTESSGLTTAGDSRPVRPWWQDDTHFGIQLHYLSATAAQTSAQRFMKGYTGDSSASVFGGATHQAELSFVLSTPWIARVQVGVSGIYDRGTTPITVPVLEELTGQTVGTADGTLTGHAWAVTVPLLIGGRIMFLDERLAATLDVGPEILAIGGMSVTQEATYNGQSQTHDSPGIVTPGPSLGAQVRAGAMWYLHPKFAVTLEVMGRTLKSGELVFSKDKDKEVRNTAGNRARLNLDGIGARVGIAGFFF